LRSEWSVVKSGHRELEPGTFASEFGHPFSYSFSKKPSNDL
jgi:hypothetical protein